MPAERLAAERGQLHVLPAEPYVLALGEERLVNDDQTIRFGSVRYSTPPGHVGARVWCRVDGDELVIVARDRHGPGRDRPPPAVHARAIRGSAMSTTRDHPGGNGPRQPRPRPRTDAEVAFLALGEGAAPWLIEAAAAGAQRVRAKMARAVELAAAGRRRPASTRPSGWPRPRAGSPTTTCRDPGPPGVHAAAGRGLVGADETHSVQPGTGAWAACAARR